MDQLERTTRGSRHRSLFAAAVPSESLSKAESSTATSSPWSYSLSAGFSAWMMSSSPACSPWPRPWCGTPAACARGRFRDSGLSRREVRATEWLLVSTAAAVPATTKRILAAFGLLALELGKVSFAASYRQIAELAGVSVGTVAKHQQHFARWVYPVAKGSRFQGTSTTWRLNLVRQKEHARGIPIREGRIVSNCASG